MKAQSQSGSQAPTEQRKDDCTGSDDPSSSVGSSDSISRRSKTASGQFHKLMTLYWRTNQEKRSRAWERDTVDTDFRVWTQKFWKFLRKVSRSEGTKRVCLFDQTKNCQNTECVEQLTTFHRRASHELSFREKYFRVMQVILVHRRKFIKSF